MFSQRTLRGTILDENKMPLPGATILLEGTTRTTTTNLDGVFSILIDKTPSTIAISYIGYITKEINVYNQTEIQVELRESKNELNEVIVIGYGSVKKKDLTGAVSSIKTTDDISQNSVGIEDIIKGRAAGVQVTANGSEPGAPNSIKIRGVSSLTGNSEPLYVIDGIIVSSATEDTGNPLTGFTAPQGGGIPGVNPQDIENIEILKDASATAIYGSRAANGVVIVTTKKGKKGIAKFNFTSSLGIGKVVRNIEVLNTRDYAEYQNKMKVVLGQPEPYTIDDNGNIFTTGTTPVEVNGVNWADDTYRTSIVKKSRLAVSGGGDKGSYYISGGLTSNQGTFPNALAKATDFNLNMNQDLTDRLKLGTKISANYTQLNSSKGADENGSSNSSMVRQVLQAAPILNLADNNQNASDVSDYLDGPRAWTADYDDNSEDIRILGALTLDYKISKSFSYRLVFGSDYRSKQRSFWYGTSLLRGKNANGEAGISTLDRFRYNVDNTLMFKKNFNKNNKIDATAGFIIDKTSIKTTQYSATNFADKSLRADGISFAGSNTPLIVASEFPNLASFIARLNYTLYNRYLFTATFRADGSTKFAEGNKWGYFPAFSFAWKLNEETFLKNSETVSNLKIRLGYGQVGNQNINSYRTLSLFTRPNSGLADANGGSLVAVVPTAFTNSALKWETAIQYNAGIDFGFFNERLSGTVDAYYKTSANLLLDSDIPDSTGFDILTANKGNIDNRGVELSLNADIVKTKNWNWSLFGNISFNRNKIGKLGTLPAEFGNLGNIVAFTGTQVSGGTYFKQPANIFIEGRQVGLFYGLETKGIIRTNEDLTATTSGDPLKYRGTAMRVGDVNFVDQNGDGDITDADKTIIGNPNPDFTYGFGSTLEHKNFSLSVMFNGVYGNEIANGNFLELGYANNTTNNVLAAAYKGAFDPVTNPNGAYPNVGVGGYGTNYTTEFNDRLVEDGSFLRLSYVTLGYNVPVKETGFIDSLKLTFSGQNLWLLTKYSGFDPEVNSFSFDPTRTGIDWGSFPNQRTFTLGLNVTF